jgi:hypothetical protein
MTIIYKIVDNTTGNCYIGSTKLDLKKRIQNHEAACRRYMKGNIQYSKSYDILKNNDYSVFELETLDDENLRYCRERYFIETENNVINKNLPFRDKAEYYLTYQEDLKAYQRKKYQENINSYRDNKLLRYYNGSYRDKSRDRYKELTNYRYIQAFIISELDETPFIYSALTPHKQEEERCFRYIQKQIFYELDQKN